MSVSQVRSQGPVLSQLKPQGFLVSGFKSQNRPLKYQTLDRAPGFEYSPNTVYNISLSFPGDDKTAIEASKAVKNHHPSSAFTLGLGKYEPKPHDSLYMIYGRKGKDTEKRLKELLAPIARKTSVFTVPVDDYLHGADGMFEIKRQNTDKVRELQKEIVEVTQEFRDPSQPYARFTPPGDERTPEWLASIPEHIRNNMEQFGYEELGKAPGIGFADADGNEGLRLHTTLTRVPANQKVDLSKLPDKNQFKGEAQGLSIYEMGPDGTCLRKIATIPFTGVDALQGLLPKLPKIEIK